MRISKNGFRCVICDVLLDPHLTNYVPYCCKHNPLSKTGCRCNNRFCSKCGAEIGFDNDIGKKGK